MDMADRTVIQDPTQSQLRSYENDARRRAAQKLADVTSKIDNGSVDNSKIHVRNAELGVDLDEWTGADAPGSSVYDNYDSPSFLTTTGATIGDQDNALVAFDSDGAFENKTGVLYGFLLAEPDTGTTSPFTEAGLRTPNSEIATYDLTAIDVGELTVVLLEDPLIIADEDRFISVYTEDDPSNETFMPLVTVAEPSGDTVSTSESFASDL